jgi:hypothetical protein
MTLIGTDELPSRSPSLFWVLPMRTEDARDVRVLVADCALFANESPCVSHIPQLAGEYRSRIEKIASAKYDGGLIEQDWSVLITQADIH